MTLVERLRGVDSPTASEAKILRFLEAHYPLVAFETIHSISEKCQVGTATVARFVAKLGYVSFSDFMTRVRGEVSSQLDTPIQRFSTHHDEPQRQSHEYLDKHVEYAVRNIERTRSRIRPAEFEKAVGLLAGNKGSLYITGSATSFGLAYFFYMLATYMRPNVVLLESNPATLSHELIDVGPDDTLLAILHYRFSTQTVEVAQWFADRSASIIVLSDRELTPVSRHATVQLFSCSDGSVMFNSRVSTLLILEALLAAMAPVLEDDVYQRFALFEDLRNRFGTFAVPSDAVAPGGLYESDGHGTSQGNRRD